MSPEQLEGEAVDQRTDIYALGITAYEMLMGKRPFPEDDLIALEEMHLAEEIPDPAEEFPDLPEALRRFIIKACRRDPLERYQNMDQAQDDLKSLAMEYGLIKKQLPLEKRKMTPLFLFYNERDQLALNRLLEEFSAKANELGINLKAADILNV